MSEQEDDEARDYTSKDAAIDTVGCALFEGLGCLTMLAGFAFIPFVM